jgi:hypothetical protein
MQDLKRWFNKAKVPVKIEKEPLKSIRLSVNNQDIFRMNIDTRGKKHKREYFRIYYGHPENDIRVIDTDSKNQQLILLVNEPERKYTVRIWEPKKSVWLSQTQKSPNFLRKYLIGMDESHLFIAELPNNLGPINKIKDAHNVLKPNNVLEKEKKTNRIKRQGEWFFIPTTQKEIELIEDNSNLIEKKMPLRSNVRISRNSHIADQLINIGEEQFVSGKISHIEHKTLKLQGWFKVVLNNEVRTSATSRNQIYNGVKFID